MSVDVARASESFSDWSALLTLLQKAFAFMEPRIDPPSSVHRLTAESLSAKAQEEALFLATDRDGLVGCVFAKPQGGALYVSKLAVIESRQRRGVGRRLMEAVEALAGGRGFTVLERVST